MNDQNDVEKFIKRIVYATGNKHKGTIIVWIIKNTNKNIKLNNLYFNLRYTQTKSNKAIIEIIIIYLILNIKY